ncbi:hypothetical protein JCM19239_3525 [Vibrio variabilis]|uniref:Uncharacterized protein n=1 Tax=Vibrio variabilis TaxID=990271 RepID=A0ABQ0JRE1_9VIBR|nr:hypothetical protein JCM19239_3525 [Vibrio variabilis]
MHHHIIWGRVFLGLGFKVSPIPAQHLSHSSVGKRTMPMMQEPFVKLIRDLIFVLDLLNLSNNKT